MPHAQQMIDSEEQSVSGMAKRLAVHRVTLHKVLKRNAFVSIGASACSAV